MGRLEVGCNSLALAWIARTRLAALALAWGALSSFRSQLLSCWTPCLLAPRLPAPAQRHHHGPSRRPSPGWPSPGWGFQLLFSAWTRGRRGGLETEPRRPEARVTARRHPALAPTQWGRELVHKRHCAGLRLSLGLPFPSLSPHPASRSPHPAEATTPPQPGEKVLLGPVGFKGAPGSGGEVNTSLHTAPSPSVLTRQVDLA